MYEHNEGRAPCMADVQEIMSKLRPSKNANPPILGLNALKMMRAQQNGFPKDMYHQHLEPQLALHEDHERELQKLGYTDTYIRQEYPKTLYRRNMDPRFAERRDQASGQILSEPWVEERIVKSKEREEALLKERVPATAGPWVARITDIDPLPSESEEDLTQTIARLQGQLDEARRRAGDAGSEEATDIKVTVPNPFAKRKRSPTKAA